MRRNVLAGLAVLAVGSATLAACGSNSGGGSAGAGGPIQIGIIAPNQSQATSLPWLFEGAQAAVDQVNAAGGVGGRKLQLNTCNGQFDPATELRCAQQAVQGKDVAMVGQLIANGAQVDPLLTQAKMANIGISAISGVDAQQQSSFVLDPTVLGYLTFAPTLKKELGITKIAMLNADTSAYDTSVGVEQIGAKDAGVDIVKAIRVPDDATDMSLYIAQARAAGAQGIALNLEQTQVLATWKALAAMHSPLKVVTDETSIDNNLKQAGAEATGSYGISSSPPGDDSSQWGKAYLAAMKKYQPSATPVAGGMVAYESVYLFAAAAKSAKGGITRASVWQAMTHFNQPFAWFSDLDYAKPGPISGYPRIAAITTYPVVVKNGAAGSVQALASFDPTHSR